MANIKVYNNGAWENVGGGQYITTKSKTSTTSIAKNTWNTIDSISLTAGLWVITVSAIVKGLAQATGYFTLSIGESTNNTQGRNSVSLNAPTANNVSVEATYLNVYASTATVNVYGLSNFDATCTACQIRAIKVK